MIGVSAKADLNIAKHRLIVFADDWGRHPSSCQHLVRNLLTACTVSWINTIGTRSPKFSLGLLHRGIEKLGQWGQRQSKTTKDFAPTIYNPIMYPGFRSAWQREINARILSRFITSHIVDLSETVILSTIPIVADLLESVHVRRWVYYCVDDFSVWPGLDSNPLRQMEEKLINGVDEIVVAGENLAARMKQFGREARIISHGIDLEFWTVPVTPCSLLDKLQHPIILFWGLIDKRLDLDYLAALDHSMKIGTIALIGPEQDADSTLKRLPRVIRLGPCDFEKLPALAANAAVLIMPYANLPVTRMMQPLKLKEYLATGRPVVSARLPALVGWEDCLDIVDSADEFATMVATRCESDLPATQALARKRLEAESWKAKSADLANVLFGE